MSLLDIQNLRVAFGAATVVQDVSLSIAPGEKFALVGESGSGKTVTSLSILRLNQDAQYGGRILFDGADLLKKPEAAMRAVRRLHSRPVPHSAKGSGSRADCSSCRATCALPSISRAPRVTPASAIACACRFSAVATSSD